MKSTYAYASIALALSSPMTVFAKSHHYRASPTSSVALSASVTGTVVSTAYPTATVPANSTSGGSPITAGTCSGCNGVCVTFGAVDDDLWYWWNGGPGGEPSQFGANNPGAVCLTGGGAMFVGSSKDGDSGVSTGGANTKFEWYVSAGTSNFDISVCDGFSVPMACTGFEGNESPYVTIGGGELCTNDCPASNQDGPNCRNPGAHTDLAQVPECILEGSGAEGKNGKNNYWLQDNLSVQAIFTGRTGVVCTVGDVNSSKAKRGLGQSVTASKHRHHQRRAAHGHGGLHALF